MKKDNKANKNEKPQVHPKLKGFEVSINSFGEIVSTMGIDEINTFLNQNLPDKKVEKPNPKDNDEPKP